jgi:hypothetical protein
MLEFMLLVSRISFSNLNASALLSIVVLSIPLKCSTNVFLKLFLEWISFARQSLVWERLLSFVLATLHQLNPTAFPEGENQVSVLVLCHTRELAFQIAHEYERFSKYLPDVKTAVFYGGVSIKLNRDILKNNCPHIVVGTPDVSWDSLERNL